MNLVTRVNVLILVLRLVEKILIAKSLDINQSARVNTDQRGIHIPNVKLMIMKKSLQMVPFVKMEKTVENSRLVPREMNANVCLILSGNLLFVSLNA